MEMTKSVVNAEIQAKLSGSDAIPLHHAKLRLQTEVDSLTAHATWLEQELQAKQHDYQHLQQDSRDRAIQWQLQLDQTSNELTAANAKLSVQHKLERDLQDKLQVLTRDNLDLKVTSQNQQETAAAELLEERRVIELQKEHLLQWQQRYETVVRENEHLKRTAQQALAAGDQELEAVKQALEAKYTGLLKEQAAEFEAKHLQIQQHQPDAASTVGHRFLAAAPADTINDNDEGENESPLSLTDLYEKWEESKAALRTEKMVSKRWQLLFQRIQKEIAAKAPEMIRQRQEYDMAVDQLQEYQSRLEAIIQERDDAVADRRDAASEAASIGKRLAEKQAEAQELAMQVQALLTSRAGGNTDGNIPTTIQEIQSQNQRLLVDHRRLTEHVAELEGQLQTDTLKTKLDAAEHEINAFKKLRMEQEILVDNMVQQRDLYRALLYKQDRAVFSESSEEMTGLEIAKQQSERSKKLEHLNQELESSLKAARAEMDQAIREKESMAERLSRYEAVNVELTTKANQLERDLLSARGAVARCESDAAYHKEKSERLEESLDRARSETAQVNHARAELQTINADLQRSVSATHAERARLEGEKREAVAKVRLIETQLDTARAAEVRQADDNRQLRAEIASQGALIESIQRIEASLSARTDTEKEALRRELVSVNQRLENAETKYLAQSENSIAQIAELEARIQDLLKSSQENQENALQAKKNMLEAKSELQSLESKFMTVEAQLRAAKRKLGEEDEDADDAEVTRQARIDSLEADLVESRAKVNSLQERANNYQKIAKASEDELSALQGAINDFKAEQRKENENLKQQLENSKKENASRQEIIRDLTNDLAGQRGEREKLEQELHAQILALKTEIQNNDKDVDSAKAVAAALKHDIETLRNDATSAQNNYERELGLHSQARTALRAAQENLDEETHLRKVAEEKLEGIKQDFDQHREAWEQEKSSFNEASKLLEKSVQESRDQNKVLHSQLEALNILVEKSQASRISAAGSESADGAGDVDTLKVISELREVVRFLRSENELIQSQLDASKRAADRERAATIVVRRSLEEARTELKEMHAKDDALVRSDEADTQVIADERRANEEQLKLLKDSNKLLREEADTLRTKLTTMLKELESIKKSTQPVEDVQRELGTKIVALEAEKESLSRELESWKGRMTSLVSKFNQIDPEEHRFLKNQVEEMTKAKESANAWQKATEEENNRIRSIAKKLNLQCREQQKAIESQKHEIQQLSSEKATLMDSSAADSAAQKEREELKQQIAKMDKDAKSAKTELDGANSRNDRLRERLREFQTMIRDLRAKEKTLAEQLASAQAALVASQAATTIPASSLGEKVITAHGAEYKRDPVAEIEKHESALNLELTQEIKEQKPTHMSDVSIPGIPSEGFKFGPSKTTGSAMVEKPVPSQLSATTLGPSKSSEPVVVDKQFPSQLPNANIRPTAIAFVPAVQLPTEVKQLGTESTKLTSQTPAVALTSKTTEPAKTFNLVADSSQKLVTTEPTKSEPLVASNTTSTSGHMPSPGEVERRLSGENKELVIRERLLEKKRKLAEALKQKALKRKVAVETVDQGAVVGAEPAKNEQQVIKKAKADTELLEQPVPSRPVKRADIEEIVVVPRSKMAQIYDDTTAEKVESEAATDVRHTSVATATDDSPLEEESKKESSTAHSEQQQVGDVDAGIDEDELEEEDVVVVDLEEDEDSGEGMDDSVELKKPDTPFGVPMLHSFQTSSSSNPFAASSHTFGASTTATTFGQSATMSPFATVRSTATTFGTMITGTFGSGSATAATTPVTTFGGAFLNIKPPSSDASAPPVTFTFGNSASIQLPTPTVPPPSHQQQAAVAPFGAFGPFGGGFGAPSAQMQARPLFGATPLLLSGAAADEAPVDEVHEDEADIMHDDDDEGDMDSQD